MGRTAVALAAAALGFCAVSSAQNADTLRQNPFDPALKLMQVAADSLVQNTQGRYGIMGMDFTYRTNFVVSEGGYFDCGSYALLPAACALWLGQSPLGAVLEFAPDSLISAAWEGDAAASDALALSLGRESMLRWLQAGSLLATSLSEDSSGLPWVSTVWDCMVMLALIERHFEGSGIPGLQDSGLPGTLRELAPADASMFGTAAFSPGGCRAALAVHLADGRRLGLVFFADSLEADSLVVQRARLLTSVLCTLRPPGLPE